MAAKLYVEVPSFEAVRMQRIDAELRAWLAAAIAKDARRYAPRDTGYLKAHIFPTHGNHRVTALGAGTPPDEDVPAYVEFGTRPHLIPNAFGLGITVWHPGTEAQPFLRPAAYTKRRIPPWVIHNIQAGGGVAGVFRGLTWRPPRRPSGGTS